MGRTLSALICILLVVACAPSRTGRAMNVAMAGAAVADLHSTNRALAGTGYREANPIMGQHALQRVLLKALGTGGIIFVADRTERNGRRVLAHVMRGAAIVAWGLAAGHNYRLSAR